MRSIGTKLALQIALVIVVVMITFGVLDSYQRRKQFTAFLDAKEASRVQQLSFILGEWLFYMNLDPIPSLVHASLSDDDILAIKILEGETIVAHSGKDPATKDILDFTQDDSQPPFHEHVVVRQASIVYEEKDLGTLEVVFSRQLARVQAQKTLLTLSGSLFLVIVTESLVVLTLARKNIALPLTHLVRAAERIAAGEIDIHLPEVSSRNEIGTLTAAFTKMVTYLQQMTGVATDISTGNLRHQVTPQSEKDLLGQAFLNMSAYLNEMAVTATAVAEGDLTQRIHVRSAEDAFGQVIQFMTEGLQSLIQHIRTSAEQLAVIKTGISGLTTDNFRVSQNVQVSVKQLIATVREIGTSVEDVAEKMEILLSSVEETSASVAQLAPSIGNIVSNTTELTQQTDQTRAFLTGTIQALEHIVESTETSKHLSQETIQDALKGQTAMAQVTTSMAMLQETMTTAMDAMTSFSHRSQDIGTILDVIRDIADQTSLLALNASIIAAQAGDQGKAFAVVAEEIKSLANGVATSTKDVAEIIQTLQQENDKVIQTVHEGVRNVEQGTGRTQQAQDALQKIMTSAQRSSSVVTEISGALHRLMISSHTVTEAMEKVKALTDEIHTAANEQETSTIQMNQAIAHINELASHIQQSAMYQSTGLQQVLTTTNEVTALIDQNFESSQQMTRATKNLAAQAERLLQSVDRFTLSS